MKFSGSTGIVESKLRWLLTGREAPRARQGTQMGRSGGWAFSQQGAAFEVSMVDPNAAGRRDTSLLPACSQCAHQPLRYRCMQRVASQPELMQGPDPQTRRKLTSTYSYATSSVWTSYRVYYRSSSQRLVAWPGGGDVQFQRQYWNPHWSRVALAAEDGAMNIGKWVAIKRKAFGRPDSRSR